MMSAVYETQKLVEEYLLFHYGKDEEILPWAAGPKEALGFPVRTVRHFSAEPETVARALDVGCAVGRSTLELSKNAEEVIGIDFSQAFIEAAERVRLGDKPRYHRLEEASVTSQLELSLPGEIFPERVRFETGDAMNLREDLGTFDRVHAANLVCRLPEPRKFLARLPQLVKPGGELVLATPCTWLEEFTAREHWPEDRTLEWLEKELAGHFDLIRTADEPFLIRETARKFQWTVSMVTVWKRA